MKNNSKKKMHLFTIVSAMVFMLATVLTGCGSNTTINLNDYLITNVSGYNGYGYATVTVDWNRLESDYADKIEYTKAGKENMGVLGEAMEPYELLYDSVSVSAENRTSLSNGDEVAYTWKVPEEISKYLTVNIKYENGTFKADGLTEAEKVDIFADLDVSFEGSSPKASLVAVYNGSYLSATDFTVEGNTENLKNGDEITIKINEDAIQSCAANYGVVPAETEKKYTVDGLDTLITKLNEIDNAALEQFQAEAADVYDTTKNDNYYGETTVEGMEYLGSCLLVKKTDKDTADNGLIMVYKVQLKDTYSTFSQTTDYYWCVDYYSLVQRSDGTLSYNKDLIGTPKNWITVNSDTAFWNHFGYATLNELYDNEVAKYADDYDIESNLIME